MDWKDLLKPSKGKIVIAILIFIILPVFSYQVTIMCDAEIGGFCPPYMTQFISLLGIAFVGLKTLESIDASIFLLIPLGILISYLISSWIIRKNSKLTEKDKLVIKKFLEITKGKMIIFLLGLISVGLVLLHFLSGLYGGIMNFPPLLHSIFMWFELIAILILPVNIITIWILFPVTVFSISLFVAFSGLPFRISEGFDPAYLTLGGGITVILLLIIEWYLLSCLIVWGYNKYRGKKK